MINPDGSLEQTLVQQRGVPEYGIQAVGVQKTNGGGQLLWIDPNGLETTTNTGVQDILVLHRGDAGFATALPLWLDANGHETTIQVMTTASFTQPAVSATVSVAVTDTSALTLGEHLSIAGAGDYTVSSVTDGTHLVLQSLGTPGSAAPGASIGAGAVVSDKPPIPVIIEVSTTTIAAFTQPAAGRRSRSPSPTPRG